MLSLHLGDVTELKILYKLAGESTYREILTTSTSCSVKASNNRPHEEDDNNSGDGGPPAKKQDRKEGVHLVDSDDEDEIVMGPKKSIFDDAKNLQIAATIDANTQFLAGWIQSAKKAVKEGRSLKTVCGSKKWIEKADAKVQYLKEKLVSFFVHFSFVHFLIVFFFFRFSPRHTHNMKVTFWNRWKKTVFWPISKAEKWRSSRCSLGFVFHTTQDKCC